VRPPGRRRDAFKKSLAFLAGEEEKVMGAQENLHFLTNSIPGAQGQPHERFHADHFIQEAREG